MKRSVRDAHENKCATYSPVSSVKEIYHVCLYPPSVNGGGRGIGMAWEFRGVYIFILWSFGKSDMGLSGSDSSECASDIAHHEARSVEYIELNSQFVCAATHGQNNDWSYCNF